MAKATLSHRAGDPTGRSCFTVLSTRRLTPFDREMRRKGYQVTRYADDWVVTCKSAAEARAAIAAAQRYWSSWAWYYTPQKTRVGARSTRVRISWPTRFKRGQRPLRLMPHKIRSGVRDVIYMRTKSKIDPSLYGSSGRERLSGAFL